MPGKHHIVIPLLRIFDVDKAKEFYIDWLGFKVDWEHRFGENFPLYMQVSKDNIQLHLTEHYGDCSPGARIYIRYDGAIAAYHAILSAKQYRYYHPGLHKTDWKTIEMNVTDPFGNRLTFAEQDNNQANAE